MSCTCATCALNRLTHTAHWLPPAEFWYNTNFHSSIQTTPYEVVYGQVPPVHLPYLPGDSTNLFFDGSLIAKEEAIKLLKFHLLHAQNRMSQQANKHRTNRQFAIGDNVFLRLQPYKQFTLGKQAFHKLNPKFYGPYKVTDRIGKVAYQLELPSSANIHNVFHVSQLKLCIDLATTVICHPIVPSIAPLRGDPAKKMVKRGCIAATLLLSWLLGNGTMISGEISPNSTLENKSMLHS